jgi:hypothetical protein
VSYDGHASGFDEPEQARDTLAGSHVPVEEGYLPLPANAMSQASITSDGPEAILVDEEIYCAFCNYNLTGIHAGRCPECGALFDRELLLQANREAARCVIPWGSPEPMPFFRRFWETLRLTWFRPHEFGLAFSFTRRQSGVARFDLWCLLLITAVVIVSEIVIAWMWQGSRLSWSTLTSSVVFSHVSERFFLLVYLAVLSFIVALTASSLIAYSAPDRDGQRRFWVWWTICRYALGHYAMLAAFPAFVALAALDRFVSARGVGSPILVMMWLGCTMLMCLTLGGAAQQRTGRRLSGIGAVIMVFVLVEAVLLGMFTAIVRELL